MGATLLGTFVLAYHLGIHISGSSLQKGEMRLRFALPNGTEPTIQRNGVPLEEALINETLWERIID